MIDISTRAKYLIVDSSVLPDVFLKVIEAKQLIALNKAKNPTKACEMVGLSRSTFYRYRNCVEVYDINRNKAMTLYLSLKDKPGVLATVLDILRNAGANVLTINQNMPIESVAPVCLSISETENSQAILNAVEKLRLLDEVIDAKLM